MGLADKIIPHYTYEDWIHWEGKWELLEGHPIAMSPSPIPKHQRVVAEIIYELIAALKKSACKDCRVYDGMDYVITSDTILVPDILIVCGEIKNKFLDFPPNLVVEIVSPSTALRDRNTKFQLYQQQGVPYYLIADPEKDVLESYRLAAGEYRLMTLHRFELEDACIIEPKLHSVFS